MRSFSHGYATPTTNRPGDTGAASWNVKMEVADNLTLNGVG